MIRYILEEDVRAGDELGLNGETGKLRRRRPGDERWFITLIDIPAGTIIEKEESKSFRWGGAKERLH